MGGFRVSAEPGLPKFRNSSFRKCLLSTSCGPGTVPVTVKGRPRPLPHRADIRWERVNSWSDQVAIVYESKAGEACRVLEEGAWQRWSNWRVREDLCQRDTPLNLGGEKGVPLCEDVGGGGPQAEVAASAKALREAKSGGPGRRRPEWLAWYEWGESGRDEARASAGSGGEDLGGHVRSLILSCMQRRVVGREGHDLISTFQRFPGYFVENALQTRGMLTTALQSGSCYHPHFTDGRTEALVVSDGDRMGTWALCLQSAHSEPLCCTVSLGEAGICAGEAVKDSGAWPGEGCVRMWVPFGVALMSLAVSCSGLREVAEGPTAPDGHPVPVQLGPADHWLPTRREFRHKSNITFNDNDTVSFLEYRSFQFQPDKSHGLESDYIVMPNILVLVRPPLAAPLVPALILAPGGFRLSSCLPPALAVPRCGGQGAACSLWDPTHSQ